MQASPSLSAIGRALGHRKHTLLIAASVTLLGVTSQMFPASMPASRLAVGVSGQSVAIFGGPATPCYHPFISLTGATIYGADDPYGPDALKITLEYRAGVPSCLGDASDPHADAFVFSTKQSALRFLQLLFSRFNEWHRHNPHACQADEIRIDPKIYWSKTAEAIPMPTFCRGPS